MCDSVSLVPSCMLWSIVFRVGDRDFAWLICSFVRVPRLGMVATSIIQPMDMIKVRIQLSGEGAKGKAASPFALASQLIKNEGFLSLYKGLSAGLLRQVKTFSIDSRYERSTFLIYESISPSGYLHDGASGSVPFHFGLPPGSARPRRPALLAEVRCWYASTVSRAISFFSYIYVFLVGG